MTKMLQTLKNKIKNTYDIKLKKYNNRFERKKKKILEYRYVSFKWQIFDHFIFNWVQIRQKRLNLAEKDLIPF